MSTNNSTAPRRAGKPAKPYPEFPLFPHATGRWAKKIRGKLHYFGPCSDPNGAVQKYLVELAQTRPAGTKADQPAVPAEANNTPAGAPVW